MRFRSASASRFLLRLAIKATMMTVPAVATTAM
jgi:hypothetical protein